MTNQYESHFPLGIAKGKAFIGREEEVSWLHKNILAGIHTLLLAPRRYGKSSLVLHALEKSHLHHVEIDLQLCRSAKSVEKKIIRGVEKIITESIKEKEKILRTAKTFFKKNNKQWKIGLRGFIELTIEPDRYDDVAENILTVLQFLDTALAEENKKSVIFIDEMQEVSHIELSAEIQGAVRHFAQKATQIVFIFSGSNRRMLKEMFNDSTMPLYQLCDTITLNKIPETIYMHYLRKISMATWNKALADEVLTDIINISERHPRRIYNLCLYLWRLADYSQRIPRIENVQEAWKKLILTEAKGIRYILSKKNTSQLKTLAYIALGGERELTSKTAQRTTDLSATAISKALQKLEQNDFIEQNEQGIYKIIDPVVRDVIIFYEHDFN
jgi:AAA+ ATPase superfamily predicted ATPase